MGTAIQSVSGRLKCSSPFHYAVLTSFTAAARTMAATAG